jgi:pyruvate,water dikinase
MIYNKNMSTQDMLLWLSDLDGASPMESHVRKLAHLTQAKFPILPAFLITTIAYNNFLQENNLDHKLKQLFTTISFDRPDSVMQAEHFSKQLLSKAELSDTFIEELKIFYNHFERETVSLSIFETSMHSKKHAAQHVETFDDLLDQVLTLWSQMFTSNALWHRSAQGIDHVQADCEILVQETIPADKTGTATTIDPQTHNKDRIVITMQHHNATDHYILSKKNLSILERTLHHKSALPKLTHEEILAIAEMAKRLEKHLYFPQEITWSITGKKLYLNAASPINTLPQERHETKRHLPIARGKGITSRIITGVVRKIQSPEDLAQIKEHYIVVMPKIRLAHIQLLKKSRGVIIQGSFEQPEIAALLKQYAVPTIFHVKQANKKLRDGQVVTIHGAKGEIYQGGFL